MSDRDLGAGVVAVFVIGMIASIFFGNFIPLGIALVLIALAIYGVYQEGKDEKKPAKTAGAAKAKPVRPSGSTPRQQASVATAGSAKSPVKAARASQNPAHAAARGLRLLATQFDHSVAAHFFHMNPVGVVRTTQAQEIVGPGIVAFDRGGVTIAFRNQNSPAAKPREMRKPWKDILGFSGEGELRLYFHDLTSVLFIPIEPADRVMLSAVWEIMVELTRPPNWSNGPRHTETVVNIFRQAARFLDDHPDRVSHEGEVDWKDLELDARVLHDIPERLEDMPKEGDRFLDSLLVKQLGEGGFGSVFVADSLEVSGQLKAIKLMKCPQSMNPWSQDFLRMVKQFFDESVMSSRLRHCPYVASSFDFGLEPWPWISYPFLEGVPVAEITGLRTLPKDQWWNLAHDLISALYFIHREGIVHRDIHFQNVMLVDGHAVVLDFGISQIAGHSQLKNLARAWAYSSPEVLQAERPEDISFATDIFSAGLVLFQARTGTPAWPRGRNQEERLEHLTTLTPDFSSLPQVEADLLSAMLSIDPKKRPSAHELLWRIAPHVDMEQKSREIEEAGKSVEEAIKTEVALEQGVPYPDPDPIRGPLTSWRVIDDHLRWIVEDVRPRFFTMDIYTDTKPKHLYFQAITDGTGWVIEAMSERFSDQAYAEKQKASFLRLDWSAPTDSSPNYQRHHDEHPALDISQDFSDAFEFGYGLNLADIKKVTFSIQGSGMYGGEDER